MVGLTVTEVSAPLIGHLLIMIFDWHFGLITDIVGLSRTKECKEWTCVIGENMLASCSWKFLSTHHALLML